MSAISHSARLGPAAAPVGLLVSRSAPRRKLRRLRAGSFGPLCRVYTREPYPRNGTRAADDDASSLFSSFSLPAAFLLCASASLALLCPAVSLYGDVGIAMYTRSTGCYTSSQRDRSRTHTIASTSHSILVYLVIRECVWLRSKVFRQLGYANKRNPVLSLLPILNCYEVENTAMYTPFTSVPRILHQRLLRSLYVRAIHVANDSKYMRMHGSAIFLSFNSADVYFPVYIW